MGQQSLRVNNFWGSTIFGSQQFLEVKNLVGPNKIWSHKLFGVKFVGVQHNLGSNLFGNYADKKLSAHVNGDRAEGLAYADLGEGAEIITFSIKYFT